MPRNHKMAPANESPRTPSVVSSHSRATAGHPKTNIRLRVPNRHIKSARKAVIPGRKPALVKDNKKSFGESCVWSLATLSTEGFFNTPLRKYVFSCDFANIRKTGISELRNFLHRSRFGRPIPVWGLAAVGVALKLTSKKKCRHPDCWTSGIYSDPSFGRPPQFGGLRERAQTLRFAASPQGETGVMKS